MNFRNPTPIQVGMRCTFDGRRFRVAGRVVMGMEDGGETYYWNEFYLKGETSQDATLVYEETERGGEWRLFTLFEPEFPMTAAEAAAQRVGNRVNLDGKDLPVTLVDESRVYHIEGEAPEGVEIGDVAQYLNLQSGGDMEVVSWTGDEVEFYRGVNLSRGRVAEAFNLNTSRFKLAIPTPALGSYSSSYGSSGTDLSGSITTIIVFLFIAVFFIGPVLSSCNFYTRRSNPAKLTAATEPLPIGSKGVLEGKTFTVQAHNLTEIALDGTTFNRHEYQLRDEDGNSALLVCGFSPGKRDCFLFKPVQPLEPLSPLQAGCLRAGEVVNIDGYIAPVTELNRCTIAKTEGISDPVEATGRIYYGFVARSELNLLLARWNAEGITFFHSQTKPYEDVSKLFTSKTVAGARPISQ